MIVQPNGIELTLWAANLIIDFPDENIPILTDPNNWKEWGNHLVNNQLFIQNNAPSTESFDNWQAWAQAVYYTVADI